LVYESKFLLKNHQRLFYFSADFGSAGLGFGAVAAAFTAGSAQPAAAAVFAASAAFSAAGAVTSERLDQQSSSFRQ